MRKALVGLGADRAVMKPDHLSRLGGVHRTSKSKGLQRVVWMDKEARHKSVDGGDLTRFLSEESANRYSIIHHSEITFDPEAFDFVEGFLTIGGLSVVYAPPGAGKSFFVLDLAAAIANDTPWREREVDGGPVVYFSLEGQTGFKNRMLLLQREGKLPDGAPFYLITKGLNFFDEADITGYTKSIEETLGEVKPRLIGH